MADFDLTLGIGYNTKQLNDVCDEIEQQLNKIEAQPQIAPDTHKTIIETKRMMRNIVSDVLDTVSKMPVSEVTAGTITKVFNEQFELIGKNINKITSGVETSLEQSFKKQPALKNELLAPLTEKFKELNISAEQYSSIIETVIANADKMGASVRITENLVKQYQEMLLNLEGIKDSLKQVNLRTMSDDFIASIGDIEKAKNVYDELFASLKNIQGAIKTEQGMLSQARNSSEAVVFETRLNELEAERLKTAIKILAIEEERPSWLKEIHSFKNISGLYGQINDYADGYDVLQNKIGETTNKLREFAYSAKTVVAQDLQVGDILNAGAVNTKIELQITTTTEELINQIRQRLAEVQQQIYDATSLVIPIKYVITTNEKDVLSNTERRNLEKNMTKYVQSSKDDVVVDAGNIFADIEKRGVDTANSVANQAIESIQDIFNDNKIDIQFDTSKAIKNLEEAISNKELSTEIDFSKNLEEANERARKLLELFEQMTNQLKEADVIADDVVELKPSKYSSENIVQMTKKALDEAKKSVEELNSYFVLHPVEIQFDAKKSLDNFTNEISKHEYKEQFDIATSLKKAVDYSAKLLTNLNNIQDIDFKTNFITGFDFANMLGNIENITVELASIASILERIQDAKLNQSITFDLKGANETVDKLSDSIEILANELATSINTNTFGDLDTITDNIANKVTKIKNAVNNITIREGVLNSFKTLQESIDVLSNTKLRNFTTFANTIKNLSTVNSKTLKNIFATFKQINPENIDNISIISEALNKLKDELVELDKTSFSGFLKQLESILSNSEALKSLSNIVEKTGTNLNNISRELSNVDASYVNEVTKIENKLELLGRGKNVSKYTSDYVERLDKLNEKIREFNFEVERINNLAPNLVFQSDKQRIEKLVEEIKEMNFQLSETSKKATSPAKENAILKINTFLRESSKLTREERLQLEQLINRLNNPNLSLDEFREIMTLFNNIKSEAVRAGRAASSFLDAIKNKLKYGWAQSIAMFLSFYDIIRYIREISSTVTELNSNLIELAKVSDTSIRELYNGFDDFGNIAKETGGTINDIIKSTADWARNGYNLPDSKELARLSSIFQNIGDGLSESQANEYLVSILKGFNLEANQALEIMDKINNVSNNAASSVSNIGEALERSSSSFGAANTNLSEAIALLTSANEILQSPEVVGTAFKSMSARLRSSTTELEELGEETTLTTSKLRALVQSLTGVDIQKDENTFKSIYDILLQIGEKWQNLTDIEQASLSEALFGKRNSQVGFAILNNVERLQEIYALAENSAGSAMKEQEKYLQGVQYQIDLFKASVENLVNDFMSSDVLKKIIQTGTKFIDILDTIISKLGAIPPLVTVIGTAIGSKFNPLYKIFSSFLFPQTTTPFVFTVDTDIGALASLGKVKELINEYNTSFSNLERITTNTRLSHEEFIAEVNRGNPVLASYLRILGRDSAATYSAYRRELIRTTLATSALRVATMALQGIIFGVITAGISALVSKWKEYHKTSEKIIENGEKARQTLKDVNNELQNQQKIVSDSARKFALLSQEVNQLTGKNISLSDSDYEEFLRISNELVEVFPSLTHHYDENGNAIVDLSGDVDTIVGSLQNLVDVEKQLAKEKVIESFDDSIEGALEKDKEYAKEIAKIEEEISLKKYNIEKIQSGLKKGEVQRQDIKDWEKFLLTLEGLNISYSINDLQDIITLTNPLDSNTIKNIVNTYDSEYQQLLDKLQLKAIERSKEVNTVIVETLKAFLDYSDIDEELKTALSNILTNFNFTEAGLDETKEVRDFIENLIVQFSTMPKAQQEAYVLAFDLRTRFNNDEISIKEYEKQLSKLLLLTDNLFFDTDPAKNKKQKQEFVKSLAAVFDLDVDSSGKIVNNAVDSLAKEFQNAGLGKKVSKSLAKSLTKTELEEALQLSDVDWKEILKVEDGEKTVKDFVSILRHYLNQKSYKIKLDTKTIENTTDGIKELQSTYQSLYDKMSEGKVGEDLAFLMTDIEALKAKLGDVSSYQNIWDNFFRTMTDGNHTFEEMRDALNEVLSAYVNATVDLQNFDAAEAKALSTQLQLAGVTKESADAYVQVYVDRAEAVQYATEKGYDFVAQIDSEDLAFLEEAEAAGYSKEQLALYALEKQIANGLVISTAADCENLIQLATVAGATSDQLVRLNKLKALLANIQTEIDAHPNGIVAAALSVSKGLVQTEFDNLVNDVYADAKAKAANFKFSDKKGNSSKSGGGGSKADKEEDLWKKAYEEELKALDHLHEMELISDIQYYEERERLNDKYFKDNEKYAEEYNKNLEEIYKGFQSAYKQYVDDMSDYWKKSLESNLIDFKSYCSQMETMLNSLHDAGKIDDETYFTKLGDYYGSIIENYDKAINAAQRTIKKRIDALNDEKEALEKDYQNRKDLIQRQIDGINEQINATQKEIDKLEEANKQRQAALDMQKALYELNRAENQRPDYVYNSEKGFVYQNRDTDIKAAQEELDNLRYEQQISILERTITTLNEQIDSLNEQIDGLDEELDRLTDAIDSQIDKLQEYSDKWGEVRNKYQEAQEDIIATAIWGSDWQNEILSMNESILVDFTNNYTDMQQKQVEAAVNAANAKIAAYNAEIRALNDLKEAQKSAEKTATSSAVASSTNVSSGKAKTTIPKGGNKNKNPSPSDNKAIRYAYKVGSTIHYVYGSGTDNALPGYHEIAESGDEIVLDNYGNAYLAKGRQLHRFEGGEKVYNENETRELLRGKYLPIDSLFPNYSDMLSKMSNMQMSFSGIGNSVVSKKPSLGGNTEITNSFTVTIGDINVSEVNDASALAKAITNKLPNALLQELNRK